MLNTIVGTSKWRGMFDLMAGSLTGKRQVIYYDTDVN